MQATVGRPPKIVFILWVYLGTLAAAAPAQTVGVSGPEGHAVTRLVSAAATTLVDPRCLAVIPALGGPAVTAGEAAAKLGSLRFEDGRVGPAAEACRRGAYAATTVGGSIVWTCGGLAELERRNARLARAVVTHEAMHALGLREHPFPGAPRTERITAAVLGACR
jgi:hypothetical protein